MASAPPREPVALADFLRRNRERTVQQWEEEVRRIPTARRLDLDALRDHIPALLDRVIETVERGVLSLEPLPNAHARTRLDQGFSLEQIAEEYRILRTSLMRLLEAEPGPLEAGALLVLNEAIDHAVERALGRYHQMRARTLAALDRLSREALTFEGDSLRDLLHRLLAVIVETTEDVDTAAIYLKEWDRLVLRAAAGVEARVEDDFSLAFGEGIAGTVAAQGSPYFTESAATDPLTRSPGLVESGIKALYAVPLVVPGDLIGVATMGSRTASLFSQDDRQLFEDMAQRASLLISHRMLAQERETLLGVLSHDLRSPLSTITVGATYLRKRETLSEFGSRALHRILSGADRIERMIGALSEFTKVRFGAGLPIEPEVIDLEDTLRQLVTELRAQYPDRDLRLEARGDLVGEWDRVRVGELVTNLVSNAVVYGDPSKPISVRAEGEDDGGMVSVSVHNEGTPIPPGLLRHLFQPFRRGQTHVSGMGLGLYIVKHVAKAHGGDVSVESRREGGTTFTARLPRWVRH